MVRGRRAYLETRQAWKAGEDLRAGEKGTSPARENPRPGQRKQLRIAVGRYPRDLFQNASMPERFMPRIFKGVPALVRQRHQFGRVAKESLARREFCLERASIC